MPEGCGGRRGNGEEVGAGLGAGAVRGCALRGRSEPGAAPRSAPLLPAPHRSPRSSPRGGDPSQKKNNKYISKKGKQQHHQKPGWEQAAARQEAKFWGGPIRARVRSCPAQPRGTGGLRPRQLLAYF